MAKFDEREGNSCHIHLSLRGDGRRRSSSGTTTTARARRSTTASSPACSRRCADFTLLYAPNINSYKRFADGSFAPTAIAWGEDNRTCAVRLVGHGAGARMENRVPGGDVNPYLALAAMLAGGLHGIEKGLGARGRAGGQRLRLRPAAGAADAARGARGLRASAIARAALGDEVVDHYTNMADVELAAFDAAVTDWELRRGFERTVSSARRLTPADQPGHRRQPVTEVPRPTLGRGDRRRDRARPRGVPGLARRRARRAGPAAARVRRGGRRARRRAGRARGAQRRSHPRQRPLGGRQRPRLPELLLRRARSGSSAGRSRWPAASTSPSTSRSASSA